MRTNQRSALTKASSYKNRPPIPDHLFTSIAHGTHFLIKAYHRRIVHRANGVRKKSRFVTGYIFVFTVDTVGAVSPEPLRTIHVQKATRREFAALAREVSENTDDILVSLLN